MALPAGRQRTLLRGGQGRPEVDAQARPEHAGHEVAAGGVRRPAGEERPAPARRSGRGLDRDTWYEPTDQTKSYGFRAGSYTGYGEWREGLAEYAGLTVRDYWGKPDTGQPFYELINFADNEGTIGPEAAADLLADFRQHEAGYKAAHSGGGAMDQYDIERYHHWMLAFELAAQDGMVVVH